MEEEADEDVVFQNSALYQHLRDVGFSEEEVSAAPASRITTSSGCSGSQNSKSFKKQLLDGCSRFCEYFNASQWWRAQKKSVEKEQCQSICDLVGKAGVLEEEDAAFLHNYLQLTDTSIPTSEAGSSTEKPAISVSVRVACIVILVLGYAVQTLLYPLPRTAAQSHVWLYDAVVCLIAVIGGFIPLLLIGVRWYLRMSFQRTVQEVAALVECTQEVRSSCRKSVRLVKELELVARGFTFVTQLTAVGRLEQNNLQSSQRQAPRLRHAILHVARTIMIAARDATNHLLESHSLASEGEGGCGYLSQLDIEEYGPCVTLQDGSELTSATDNYALEALKAMVELANIHMSEFLRRLVLGFLLPRQEQMKSGDIDDLLKQLRATLTHQSSSLQQAYQLQHCSVFNQKESMSSSIKAQQMSPLYTAVHSLDLHLQAALKKARRLEEELEILHTVGEDGDWDVSYEFQEQFGMDLEQVRSELDACQECCEEAANRLEKPTRLQAVYPDVSIQVKQPLPVTAPVPLFELGDPIIQDQVFEAYTDPQEVEESDWGYEPLLSEEERQKKKKEKQEAVRLLKELKSVISVKKTEMEAREQKALGRKDEKEGRWRLQGEEAPGMEEDSNAEIIDNEGGITEVIHNDGETVEIVHSEVETASGITEGNSAKGSDMASPKNSRSYTEKQNTDTDEEQLENMAMPSDISSEESSAEHLQASQPASPMDLVENNWTIIDNTNFPSTRNESQTAGMQNMEIDNISFDAQDVDKSPVMDSAGPICLQDSDENILSPKSSYLSYSKGESEPAEQSEQEDLYLKSSDVQSDVQIQGHISPEVTNTVAFSDTPFEGAIWQKSEIKDQTDKGEKLHEDDSLQGETKEAFKEKFARQCGLDMVFSANVAALAVARSHRMALEEQTFGGSSSEDEID